MSETLVICENCDNSTQLKFYLISLRTPPSEGNTGYEPSRRRKQEEK